MKRATGTYVESTTLGEVVKAFVPNSLPPQKPVLAVEVYQDLNHKAEMALARLSGVSGLVPSVDWLLYSAIRKEALLTSQIEGTQATITDLFDDEAGLEVSNTDDVEEVTDWCETTCVTPKDCLSVFACFVRPTSCYSMAFEERASSPEP
jgi:hypothetical protein